MNMNMNIISKSQSYNNISKKCNLCIEEKYYILCRPEMASLNQKTGLFTKCLHCKKHLLSNFPTWFWRYKHCNWLTPLTWCCSKYVCNIQSYYLYSRRVLLCLMFTALTAKFIYIIYIYIKYINIYIIIIIIRISLYTIVL